MNKDIYEGLRNALSRGYSLQIAMTSFHNAGYKKEEIEEAARALHQHPSTPLSHPEKPVPKEMQKPVHKVSTKKPVLKQKPTEIKKPVPKTIEQKPAMQKPGQVISKYEEKPKQKSKLGLILIILALIIILLGIVTIILFRKEVMDLISSIF